MKISAKKKILFSVLLLAICYLVVEIFVGTYYLITHKSFFTPGDLFNHSFPDNWQSNDSNKNSQCDYHKDLGPHPYLGYSLYGNRQDECSREDSNNFLMSGLDYPLEKDPAEFVIMLTGGSVADNLGKIESHHHNYMTHYFNEHFYPPHGNRFRVIVSALGDYRFPQNIIGPILHHQRIDAIIDLSGYNESHSYHSDYRLETPSPNFWGTYDDEIEYQNNIVHINNRQLLKNVKAGWCRYSYSCFFLFEKYFQSLTRSFKKSNTRYSYQQKIFLYPKDWTEEKRWEDRIKTHKGYYVILKQICNGFNFYCSYFLQPIPQIAKELTPQEKLQIINENADLAIKYQRLVTDLLKLKKENISIHSLLNVFENEKDSMYRDHIHYLRREGEDAGRGEKLVLEAIAKRVEKDWNLRRKE